MDLSFSGALNLLSSVGYSAFMFLLIINVLVFVHEMGHFIFARWSGVKVEAFSLGFGREVFGWNDSKGTRWKIALYPLGGYVQMYGDADAASTPDSKNTKLMSEEEKKQSFHYKAIWQKFLIVLAGPMANYLFAIIAMTFIYFNYGKDVPTNQAVVGVVMKDKPADKAGLKSGDVIVSVDGKAVNGFEEFVKIISDNPGAEISLDVLRDNAQKLKINITPEAVKSPDGKSVGKIGIMMGFVKEKVGFVESFIAASKFALVDFNVKMIDQIGKMFKKKEASGLSGPLGIAQMSGKLKITEPATILFFMVMLSLSLGFLNLLPIPMLDGGHLFMYLIEGVIRRPLSEKFQDIFFKAGLVFIFLLFLLGLRNDLLRIVYSFYGG